MSSAIAKLKNLLDSTHVLAVKNPQGDIINLPDFSKFRRQIELMEIKQDFKRDLVPPSEKIKQAINKLTLEKIELSKLEWRLVFWGLNEKSNLGASVIEEDNLFQMVSKQVSSLTKNNKLSRRDWTALCASYFSYPFESDVKVDQWLKLRQLITKSFDALVQNQRRPKVWSELIRNNSDIFTDNANILIGDYLINGNQKALESLSLILPISVNSWLWKQVFSRLHRNLEKLTDEIFHNSIKSILDLTKTYPQYKNFILAALLKRYFHSSHRKISNQDLKENALLMWGSPQIKSDKNRWLTNVSEDELAMAMRWFARDDLEHFFKLLQGTNAVDQRRLDFWLNYVDQISYTRIVMGYAAINNRNTDFKEFRQKNAGRYSQLLDAPIDNNAFVLKIKDHWFVEFSETSNACYVYTDDKLPFSPDSLRLDMRLELKNKNKSCHTIIHRADWEHSASSYLKSLGIYQEKLSVQQSNTNLSNNLPHNNSTDNSTNVNFAIAESRKILAGFNFATGDNLRSGGFYRIYMPVQISNLDEQLKDLGFKYIAGEGYVIK